ncbi:NADP-dependent oxidoreductase domain-containing protein [Truncatella angustata]|uniref:NADP-dependent oxidoreductase domain-containing protein n=1 Tax=Truncatella angustata TaxID=152316 RepID=A0A9P8UUM3_9PEZI|nr:NADP-dependent oxidoreductase domain-containing protein [Truncatella angustata]KAH6658372.1 NADP-dependent oxidoreductase domain-containing protein [Truncatella angustata]
MATKTRNRLILGTMTIGPDPKLGARITDIEVYKQCLSYFASRGYREVDTAQLYVGGRQEAFTREALAGLPDLSFDVASKVYPKQPGDHAAGRLSRAWDESLENLGIDRPDIFYLHAPDRSVPYEETLEAADKLYREGKFGRLGLSNYASWEVAEMVGICERRGFVRPAVYQGMYNAITRAAESELIPALRKFGISLIAYNPLAAGLFSGKYTTLDKPAEGRFSDSSSLGKMYQDRFFKQSNLDALALVEPVAKKHGIPLIEVGLRWVIHHSQFEGASKGGDDGLLLGFSSYDQLIQNVEAAEKGPLPDDVVEALDKAWVKARGDAPTYWR